MIRALRKGASGPLYRSWVVSGHAWGATDLKSGGSHRIPVGVTVVVDTILNGNDCRTTVAESCIIVGNARAYTAFPLGH